MIIRRDTIKAVLPATSKDGSRAFTHSILIEPDGRCVATNGHVLLTAKDRSAFEAADFPTTARVATGSPESAVLLEAATAEKLIAAMPKKSVIPILQSVQIATDATGPFAVATDLSMPAIVDLKANNGPDSPRFPDWRRVMPKDDEPVLRLKLGVPVLKALIKAAEAASTSRGDGPYITFELPMDISKYAEARKGDGGKYENGLIAAFRVRISGTDVNVDGCAMPVR